MKSRFLIILVATVFFAPTSESFAYYNDEVHSESEFVIWDKDSSSIGKWARAEDSSVNLDSELSPSYVSYEEQIFGNPNSIFVAGPVLLGMVSMIFIIPHLILKRKKIPSRPYVLLIAAGIMLFFGLPNLVGSLFSLGIILLSQTPIESGLLLSMLMSSGFTFALVAISIGILLKSQLIRKGLRR